MVPDRLAFPLDVPGSLSLKGRGPSAPEESRWKTVLEKSLIFDALVSFGLIPNFFTIARGASNLVAQTHQQEEGKQGAGTCRRQSTARHCRQLHLMVIREKKSTPRESPHSQIYVQHKQTHDGEGWSPRVLLCPSDNLL